MKAYPDALATDETPSIPRARLKVSVFIDHDIFVRHFLHSGVLRPLFKRHEVDVIVPPPGHKRLANDPTIYVDGARLLRLSPNPERHRLWSLLLQVSCMRPYFDRTSREVRRMWRIVLTRKAEILYTALGVPGVYSFFRQWIFRRVASVINQPLNRVLENNYDVVLVPGTPGAPFSLDMLYECNRRNLPCILIMNSWDNPSGARRVSGMPDLYLVWGEQTRRHAIEFLRLPPDRAISFGAAQFDLYRERPRIDRETFAHCHGIDPEKKIVLYAGGSLGTDEFKDLTTLDCAIETGQLAGTSVVYRPHPWGGNVERAEKVLAAKWKHVSIESTMRTYLEQLRTEGYHIMLADTRDTHDVLSSVDAVVSPMSTILVEAMIHRKPLLCYLPLDDVEARHFQAVHDMTHFRDVQTSPEVLVARDRSELITTVRRLIGQIGDANHAAKLGDRARFFVNQFDRSYGDRLADLVEQCSTAARPESTNRFDRSRARLKVH